MLILSRLPSQKIIIGNKGEVCISVLSVDGEEVKLGLIAAKDIIINKMETAHQQIQKRSQTSLSIKVKAFCAKINKAIKEEF